MSSKCYGPFWRGIDSSYPWNFSLNWFFSIDRVQSFTSLHFIVNDNSYLLWWSINCLIIFRTDSGRVTPILHIYIQLVFIWNPWTSMLTAFWTSAIICSWLIVAVHPVIRFVVSIPGRKESCHHVVVRCFSIGIFKTHIPLISYILILCWGSVVDNCRWRCLWVESVDKNLIGFRCWAPNILHLHCFIYLSRNHW